jgi:hypothetical protein
MYNIVETVFSMKMDIYQQSEIQDSDTGAIKKEWNYAKTVNCHAKAIISNSATSRSGNYQVFKDKYVNEQIVVIRTTDMITFREKITNIRSLDGKVIWEEINYPSNTPTVFEVIGTTPITDPYGGVLAYNTTVKRSENQIIGV